VRRLAKVANCKE